MIRILNLVLALVLACVSLCVSAASADRPIEQRLTAEQMHATGLDTLSPLQLTLLNRLLLDQRQITVQSADVAVAADSPAPATLIGLDESPVRSRAVGRVDGWESGTVFTLENGEKWKVLKGTLTLPIPLESPSIEVIAGIAGRWFLQVSEDLPKARVYRIR